MKKDVQKSESNDCTCFRSRLCLLKVNFLRVREPKVTLRREDGLRTLKIMRLDVLDTTTRQAI